MVEMTTSHKQPALLVLCVKHSVAIATDAHQLNTMLFIRTELSTMEGFSAAAEGFRKKSPINGGDAVH